MRRRVEKEKAADERILGSGAFVEEIWRAANDERAEPSRRNWEGVLEEIVVDVMQILGGSREPRVSRAQREFFLRALEEGGLSITQLGRLCAMNPAWVSRAIELARAEREGRAGE